MFARERDSVYNSAYIAQPLEAQALATFDHPANRDVGQRRVWRVELDDDPKRTEPKRTGTIRYRDIDADRDD